eukprot:3763515-Amphidinium_carterae.1
MQIINKIKESKETSSTSGSGAMAVEQSEVTTTVNMSIQLKNGDELSVAVNKKQKTTTAATATAALELHVMQLETAGQRIFNFVGDVKSLIQCTTCAFTAQIRKWPQQHSLQLEAPFFNLSP